MTAAASASDALLERATKGATVLGNAINGFRNALNEARAEADLVERMKAVARLILAAEHIEDAAKGIASQARASLCEVMAENGVGIDIGTHTVFTREGAGTVRITDATAIPAEFIRQPPPVPDKEAIGKALRAGQEVPGATITNGAPALSFRSKKAQAA